MFEQEHSKEFCIRHSAHLQRVACNFFNVMTHMRLAGRQDREIQLQHEAAYYSRLSRKYLFMALNAQPE